MLNVLVARKQELAVQKQGLKEWSDAPVSVSGFFAGMKAIEVRPGVTLHGTEDLINAWITYYRLLEANRVLRVTRDDAVMNEMVVMRDLVLPVGAEVVVACKPHTKSVGKILSISTGYRERPLYALLLRGADGNYPVGSAIQAGVNEIHVYARDLVASG